MMIQYHDRIWKGTIVKKIVAIALSIILLTPLAHTDAKPPRKYYIAWCGRPEDNIFRPLPELFSKTHGRKMISKGLRSGSTEVFILSAPYQRLYANLVAIPFALRRKALTSLRTKHIDIICKLGTLPYVSDTLVRETHYRCLRAYKQNKMLTAILGIIVNCSKEVLARFSPQAIEQLADFTAETTSGLFCHTGHSVLRHQQTSRSGSRSLWVRRVKLLKEFDARATDEIRATYTEKTNNLLNKDKKS